MTRFALHVFLTLLLTLAPFGLAAQEEDDPGARLVQRAEDAIESGAASVAALSVLRSDLEERREELTAIVSGGNVRGRALQAQIDALGPPPGEDETEPADIAASRAELEERLAEVMHPIRQARGQLNETELLLDELDDMIRRKAASQLIDRYPSVLSPGTLATARHELSGMGRELRESAGRSLQSRQFRENPYQVIATVVALLVAGMVLIVVARPIGARYFDRRFERATRAHRYLWAMLSSLTSLVIPLAGAVLLALIVPNLGIQSRIVDFSGRYVFFAIVVLVLAHWLGHTVFSPDSPSRRLVDMPDDRARRGLRLCQALGLVQAASVMVEALSNGLVRDEETISVMAAPVVILAALVMWRLAAVLSVKPEPEDAPAQDDESEIGSHAQGRGLNTVVPYMLRVAGAVSAVLVLIGYVPLARHISDAATLTAAMAGVGLFLFALLLGSIRAIMRRGRHDEGLSLPLLPFTIGTLLCLAMLPLLAIVWGAQVNDVAEAWRLVTVGIEVGDVRISIGVVVSLLVAFALGTIATRWLQRSLRDTVLPNTKMDAGARNALVTGVGYVGLTISALVAFSAAGLSLSSLAVVAGALSLGIGFGMQTIVSNFVSGIILLIERPIAEGDWIEVSGYSGTVKKIAVRSTQISTFDKHDVIVPNQDLIGGVVKNMTLSSRHGRLIIPIGVAYGSDLDKVKEILEQAAKEQTTLLRTPPPVVLFRGMGDSALDFELRCYLRNVDDLLMTQSDLLFRIYKALNAAEIEIPFPQRDIHVRGITTSEIEKIETADTKDDKGRASKEKDVVDDPDGYPSDQPT
ncbi:mechanosensitive ion channel domain-containing protein [Chachezhania antarctica]|uniref:mechanosensitive ion channel domain-containing protein n=1 Tax=Chachezhania antarctica TaxID=2340860 RepID=UPI0013CF252F|nr:mechanosensitive ion channel domain-containing protein [Chachezhania antarctica]